MARHRTLDLTDQQHRVLDLMAHGRTNYDIAQDLGVSLEGAKYHIRQVFDKLGVDSREEAIAAWHESRGSLLERVRGFLWPVGAIAAGGVVAAGVAIVVVAVMLAAGGGKKTEAGVTGDSKVAPGAWVVMIKPTNPQQSPAEGPLEVFKAGDKAHAHTIAGMYLSFQPYGLKWSPDGRHIAVMGQAEGAPLQSSTALWIFSRDGYSWTSSSVAGLTPNAPFSWAPDGSGLAVLDPEGKTAIRALFVSPGGQKLAEADLPPLTAATDNIQGAPLWSPDGKIAAWGVQGHVLVMSAGGVNVYTPPKGPLSGLQVTGWSSDRTVLVTPGSASLSINGSTGRWIPTDNAAPSTTRTPRPAPGANVTTAWTHLAGGPPIDAGATADGSGSIFTPGFSAQNADALFDFQIVVQDASGQLTTADLGQRRGPPVTTLQGGFDVVITK